MNIPAPAASSASGSIDPNEADGTRRLRAGLELARASHLTILRLELALHQSNRRTALQALDDLLDIDAEMEGLAATLGGVSTGPAGDALLSNFIGLQKAAIATEKHALTGDGWRSRAKPISVGVPDDWDGGAKLPPKAPPSLDQPVNDDRGEGRHWMHLLFAIIIMVLFGFGVLINLRPELLATMVSFFGLQDGMFGKF